MMSNDAHFNNLGNEDDSGIIGEVLADGEGDQRFYDYVGTAKALETLVIILVLSHKREGSFAKAEEDVKSFFADSIHFRAALQPLSGDPRWNDSEMNEISTAAVRKMNGILDYFRLTPMIGFINADGTINHAKASRFLRNLNVRW